MITFLNKFFNSGQREIESLKPIVFQINALEEDVKKVKDKDFPEKTEEFKERLKKGELIENILPEAFAYAREAARRTIGQRHFDVQLMAGIVLAHGKIAEQKTGEGKTLSAVPALYLNSLYGKGVHLVTVNDYLARRDAGWMGPIFNLLGLKVSSIISEQSFIFDLNFTNEQALDFRLLHLRPTSRKEAYLADVVYGINSEYGFDYLRDNMATSIEETAQRGHFYAIVDEVDSVLIDEARTPHIISAPDANPSQKYYEYAKIVKQLNPDIDYKIDEKLRTAHLTDHGIAKIEKLYGISNIYEKDFDTVYHLEAALKANTLFHREKDYIVKENQVILVDEFTGRLLVGRRLSEGIHQAIEAKEGVNIQRESKTLATVSLQNYFRMYKKLAGMTGTAATEAEEFHKIYKLDVIVIPTNNPMVRSDHQDAIYKTGRAKYTAVVNEIEKAHKKGQPVLVGTTSIEKNEIISESLKRRGIKHEVLNAKNHLREAEIIAQAGEKGAVTVATNMAGRGVDIVLGGDSPKHEDGREKRGTKEWEEWDKRHKELLKLGGLYVIGTERHESRRVDNQLRGRSGRQGDPGASRFFVALDDDIMRIFGGDMIAGLMTRFNMPEDVPLEHPMVSRAISQAQIKVEGFNFDIRKHLVEYDDVLNKQREIVYKLRRKVLEAGKVLEASDKEEEVSNGLLRSDILEKIRNNILSLVKTIEEEGYNVEKPVTERIVEEYSTIIPFDDLSKQQLIKQLEQLSDVSSKEEFLNKLALDVYEKREKQVGEKLARQIEQFVMLSVIDNLWMDHLDAVDNLRQGIGLRGYGQRDPLVEYKNEAFNMFEKLIYTIDDEVVHRVFKVQVASQQEINTNAKADLHGSDNQQKSVRVASHMSSGNSNDQQKSASGLENVIGSSKKKLGRNDPCYCGSGKKYKKCHLNNDLGR